MDGVDQEIVEKGGKARVYPSVSTARTGADVVQSQHQAAVRQHLRVGHGLQTLPAEQAANQKAGAPAFGVKFPAAYDRTIAASYAIDPLTGKAKWEQKTKSPNIAGTLVTAGRLVFTGMLTGEFVAVDADTGKTIWQFQTVRHRQSAGDVGKGRQAVHHRRQRQWWCLRRPRRRSKSCQHAGGWHGLDLQADG